MPNNIYQDDPSILNDDVLLRRVPIHQGSQIVWDANKNQWRPSSAAFRDHPNGPAMSVALQSVLDALALPPQQALVGYEETHALAAFQASIARQNGQGIARDPLPEDPAHAVVFGPKNRAVSKALANASNWAVPPNLDPPDNADTGR